MVALLISIPAILGICYAASLTWTELIDDITCDCCSEYSLCSGIDLKFPDPFDDTTAGQLAACIAGASAQLECDARLIVKFQWLPDDTGTIAGFNAIGTQWKTKSTKHAFVLRDDNMTYKGLKLSSECTDDASLYFAEFACADNVCTIKEDSTAVAPTQVTVQPGDEVATFNNDSGYISTSTNYIGIISKNDKCVMTYDNEITGTLRYGYPITTPTTTSSPSPAATDDAAAKLGIAGSLSALCVGTVLVLLGCVDPSV